MKRLEIEWKHLEKGGRTCERCGDTGETLRRAVQDLRGELRPRGWEIALKETLLTEKQIPESNAVLFNGVPLEDILPQARRSENCCSSCEELLGLPTMCRVIEYQGETYEALPASLIKDAAHWVVNHNQ